MLLLSGNVIPHGWNVGLGYGKRAKSGLPGETVTQGDALGLLGSHLRIPMKADTCSDSYRTLIRRYRTVVGAKRRSVVSNKELSDMRQENRA
jgi:hypothetical protein